MATSLIEPGSLRIRAALFVDFDNVYIGLRTLDPAAAEQFATDPGRWTQAIADGAGHGDRRRFLIRNCYLNPSTFSKYRAYWTRAGFRVIDCPSLTQQGKSSTDINLVLDAIDILSGPGKIEEFFLASADADFTSLVQRFRAADRLTTVIVAGGAASAYREMADAVVEADDFVAILNGTTAGPHEVVGGAAADRIPISTAEPRAPGDSGATAATGMRVASPAADAVFELIRSSPGPVAAALVAHRAHSADPQISDNWGGFVSFGAWLAQFAESIGTSFAASPGWAWDTARFSAADLPGRRDDRREIEKHVTRVTDVPSLSTSQFQSLFESLGQKQLKRPFNRNEVAKQVRDECAAAGEPVPRSAVNFVIQSLMYADVALEGPIAPGELAAGWTKHVEALCRGARMEFDLDELAELRAWVSGGFVK